MKHKILFGMLSVIMLIILIFPVYAAENSKVMVEVIINNYDEEYIKNIEFDDGTTISDYDYKITYLPKLRDMELENYFNYVAWITRDNEVSLSLDPKLEVRSNSSTKDVAWNSLKSPTIGFGSDSNWKNEKVLKWQYDCHFDFAKNKERWNLEPHRTANSYLEVVFAGCNP